MNQRETLPQNLLPPDDGEREVFQEPWQAEAFAMTHHLADRGVIGWSEWTASFSAGLSELRPDAGNYFDIWLRTLEGLLIEKGLTERDVIESLTRAWSRAAEATPHGKPILLENDPLGVSPGGAPS